MIQLTTLTPLANNPRTITDAALARLRESLDRDPELMQARPLILDGTTILAGNQRFRALTDMGYTEIPESWIFRADDWPEEKKRRAVLVDNGPEGMAGSWDVELLRDHWMDVDLDAIGLEVELETVADIGETRVDEKTANPLMSCPKCGFEFA